MKPYFEISRKIVLKQYRKLTSISDSVAYSSKTNPQITPILEEHTDALFSVHVMNELRHINDMSRVMFLPQAWKKDDVSELLKKGVTQFVMENEQDLDILLDTIKEQDARITLLLRMKLKEQSLRTERHYVFGMDSATINKRIAELKDNKNIAALGIHFHRKTQNMAEWSLQDDIEEALTEETMKSISIMNIGGGIPSVYTNTNPKAIDAVMRRIKGFKDYLNKKGISLMTEPGRFISAPAGKLFTEILAIHGNTIIVNTSVYNTNMDAILVPIKLLIEGECTKDDKEAQPYVVKGMTPDSMDIFRYRVYLKNPKQGEHLVFANAGAYNFASDFCDLEKPETRIAE